MSAKLNAYPVSLAALYLKLATVRSLTVVSPFSLNTSLLIVLDAAVIFTLRKLVPRIETPCGTTSGVNSS